jgi:DNA-binding transcriptional ArsR family regulator
MDTFAALAEPTRRNILEMLAEKGELSASDIYGKFRVSPQAISQHLKILRETHLVLVEKRAQQRIYTINPKPMKDFEEWIRKFTEMKNEQYDRLDALLEEEKEKFNKERR